MAEFAWLAIKVGLIGIGATLILDLVSVFLKVALKIPAPNWALVGRWIGHFLDGEFAQTTIAAAPNIRAETMIGWITHYLVGVVYAWIFVSLAGLRWMLSPSISPALLFGVVTVMAPFFIMQPAMGMGIAASRAPNANVVRLRSLAMHTVFGIGLYLSALIASWI